MFSWTWDLRRALARKERQRDADAVRLARERLEVEAFCSQVLGPALDDIRGELERLGRAVAIRRLRNVYHLTVTNDRSVRCCSFQTPSSALIRAATYISFTGV